MIKRLLFASVLVVASACSNETSVSGWVRDVTPTDSGVRFTLLIDGTPPTLLTLTIVGQLEGGGENFDANHLLDHAAKGLPVALTYTTDASGAYAVLRATDAIWLNDRTPPALPQ